MSVSAQATTLEGARAPMRDHAGVGEHMQATVRDAALVQDPFCHIYMEGFFPSSLYLEILRNLPAKELYEALNLRKWVRADGTSTRDQFYLSTENIAKLPPTGRALWASIVEGIIDGGLKRTIFAKLAPDIAARFGVPVEQVPDLDCVYDIMLVRDTEDYRIKPHPDGLNKLVTLQLYLPEDESQIELGTSLFVRHRGLLGSRFEEVKRFEFKPNSAYAFAVSESPQRTSWHGRDRLTGFTGVRNTMMILFQRKSEYRYQ